MAPKKRAVLAPNWLLFQNVVFSLYLVSLATSMSGMEIFSTLLAICVAVSFWLEGTPFSERVIPPFLVPMGIFIAVASFGILLGDSTLGEKVYDLRRMRFFLIYPIVFFYLYYYAKSAKWVWVSFAVCLFIGAYALVQHFVPIDIFRPEGKKIFYYAIQEEKLGPLVIGSFNHHLTYANAFLFYVALFAGMGAQRFPKRWQFLGLGLLLALTVYWTNSRMGWIATPIVLGLAFYQRGRKWVMCAVGGVALVALTLFLTDRGFQERLLRTIKPVASSTNTNEMRTRLWNVNLIMFMEHPILGIGWNNSERRAREYMRRAYPTESESAFTGHAHSTPLQILSTTGIVGFGAFVWMWWAIFAGNLRLIRSTKRTGWESGLAWGLLAGFVGFLLQGITQWNFGDAEVVHNLFFFIAVLAAVGLLRETRAPGWATP